MGHVFLDFIDDEAIKFKPMGVVNSIIFRRRLCGLEISLKHIQSRWSSVNLPDFAKTLGTQTRRKEYYELVRLGYPYPESRLAHEMKI